MGDMISFPLRRRDGWGRLKEKVKGEMIKAGIDPTYFGVMFVLIGTLGLIHPPVCTVLNVVCGVARISLESATKGIWPFLLTYIVLLGLMIAVPEIITMPLHLFH